MLKNSKPGYYAYSEEYVLGPFRHLISATRSLKQVPELKNGKTVEVTKDHKIINIDI